MSVLVDTSVWSLALRRRREDLNPLEHDIVREWSDLVRQGRVRLVGPIRQEILSGVRRQEQFARLLDRLADFDDVPCETEDYEEAARLFNRSRAAGITGTPVDLLICAVAGRLDLTVFTTDPDFRSYAKHLAVRLHTPRPFSASPMG